MLYGPGPHAGVSSFILAPDGMTTFIVTGVLGPTGWLYSLHHAGMGTSSTVIANLTSTSTSTKHAPFGMPIVASPNSRMAAYIAAPDSVKRYDIAARTSTLLATGCNTVLAFTPDGARLLCARAGGEYRYLSVTNGVETSAGPRSPGTQLVHLGPDGLQQLRYGPFGAMDILNTTTGATMNVVTTGMLDAREIPYPSGGAWSNDGRRVALATSRACAAILDCPFFQLSIYVLEVATGRLQRVAVVNAPKGSDPDVEAITFSPDGNRVAYVAQWNGSGTAYVVTVP